MTYLLRRLLGSREVLARHHRAGTTQVPCYTGTVANLTLTIDDTVLRRARIRALELDTSVNALVREYLTEFAASSDLGDERDALLALIDASSAGSEADGRTWSREEAYEDRLRWPRS